MAEYEYAIRPTTNRLMKALRQQYAVTGERPDPEEIRAIVEGGLGAEASMGVERAKMAENKRRFDENLAITKKRMEAEERASAVTGVAQLGALAYDKMVLDPKRIAVAEGRTKALENIAKGFAPTSSTATAPLPGVATKTGGWLAENRIATGPEITSQAAKTAKPGIGTTAIVAQLGGRVGTMLGENVSWLSDEAGGYLGSAAAGFVVGGPVGALIGLGSEAISDATVICEELHSQGYMPDEILRLDGEYREKFISVEEYIGYRMFADPIVNRMRRNRLVTLLVKPFALAWAYTMANQIDRTIKVNPLRRLVGRLILYFGLPLCRAKFKKSFDGGICYG